MQAALRMKSGQASADPETLLAAVRLNWRLWTILQAELLDPECPVPAGIRNNVLSLARFVDKRTVDVLAAPQADKVDILISINRELAGGLFEGGSAAQAAAAPLTTDTVRVST